MQGHLENFIRPPQDLLTRNCKRPGPRSSCQDPEENPTRSSSKDLLLLERVLQDLETRTSQEHPRRASIQAPLRYGICKILFQGPLGKDLTISTRPSDKGLCKIMLGPLMGTSPGSQQDLLIRTCARPRKDSSRLSAGSSQDLLIRTWSS